MACEVHKEQREQNEWKGQILAGRTWIQEDARSKRKMLLSQRRFREPGFVYMGDTVVIWNLREYMANPKWREDALRKANKRKAREMESGEVKPRLTNSRKRFHRIVNELYQRTLQEK
jgi:hypothetical protein